MSIAGSLTILQTYKTGYFSHLFSWCNLVLFNAICHAPLMFFTVAWFVEEYVVVLRGWAVEVGVWAHFEHGCCKMGLFCHVDHDN